MEGWEERAARGQERYEDGAARLPDEPDERQRQLTRMGNAAWGTGLSLLMLRRRAEAEEWLLRAAETYRESWTDAPPGSWGRPIGALKSRLIAGDVEGARQDADWALAAGAADSESPIGRYAAVLAELVLGHDAAAAALVATLVGADSIPPAVTSSLAALADSDPDGYEAAIRDLIADFESREEFLEDVAVADTVLALQALAVARGMDVALNSVRLPRDPTRPT
jgi:hypothetical protein